MASRAVEDLGVGHVLDADLLLAHPAVGFHSAIHLCPSSLVRTVAFARRRAGCRPRCDAGVRMQHLARLEDLLQAPQVAGDLLRGLFAEQLCDGRAQGAAWWLVFQLDAHLRAAIARRRLEAHHARLGTRVPSTDRQPIASSGRSITTSACHSTVVPAGPLARQVDVPFLTVTDSRWAIKRGKFSRFRQNAYTSEGGRPIVIVLTT